LFTLPNLFIISFTTIQFEVFVGCLELHSKGGCLFFKKPDLASINLFVHIDLGVDAPDFLPDIIISSTFWILCSRLPVGMTFTSGPQVQPIRFQSQFPVATFPRLSQRIVFLLFISSRTLVSRSTSIFIPSCRSRLPLSPAQDCASFSPVNSSSSIGSPLFHQ
jgi:hypothetical protein